jgi:hypothetical protein
MFATAATVLALVLWPALAAPAQASPAAAGPGTVLVKHHNVRHHTHRPGLPSAMQRRLHQYAHHQLPAIPAAPAVTGRIGHRLAALGKAVATYTGPLAAPAVLLLLARAPPTGGLSAEGVRTDNPRATLGG